MEKNPLIRNMTHHFVQLFDLVMLLDKYNLTDTEDPNIIKAINTHLQAVIFRTTHGIQAIGVLLAVADQGEIPDYIVEDIGWLLDMLGELANSGQELRDELDFVLKQLNEED